MNFLGHLFLSGDTPLEIVGNFMGDGVKGRLEGRFPEALERGLRRHRFIDSFTDQHPDALEGRDRLRAHAGRYSGVVLDLFFDHLLAVQWHRFHDEPLDAFAERMYTLLSMYRDVMPGRIRHMLPYMIEGDWLVSYASLDGLGGALHGLSRRAVQGDGMRGAERVLERHYHAYTAEFGRFMEAIQQALQQAYP